MAWDPRMRAYVDKRRAEGKSSKEIIRCLKRHIAQSFTGCLSRSRPNRSRRARRCQPRLDTHRSFGKAKPFNRTLLTDWAYARPWTSNTQRTAASDGFLERYDTRRAHTTLEGRPPISRLAA
jgi:hypothetical protein